MAFLSSAFQDGQLLDSWLFLTVEHFLLLCGLLEKEQDNARYDAQDRNDDAKDGDFVVAHGCNVAGFAPDFKHFTSA